MIGLDMWELIVGDYDDLFPFEKGRNPFWTTLSKNLQVAGHLLKIDYNSLKPR